MSQSDEFVVFNVRYGKSSHTLKINTPKSISGFIETLKHELEFDDINELVLLCPTSEGKMMELQSDSDIEYLMKNKLYYNVVNKEIYCNVELVAISIRNADLNDPQVQIKVLTNKIEQLGSKLEDLSQSLNNKIEESLSIILENIKLNGSDHPLTDTSCSSTKYSNGEQSSPNVDLSETKTKMRQKKPKMEKEKVISITTSNDEVTPNSSKNSIQQNHVNTKDIDTLLGMLVSEGYTNTIQNIIVLKRFDNDFEKAINYLKSSPTL